MPDPVDPTRDPAAGPTWPPAGGSATEADTSHENARAGLRFGPPAAEGEVGTLGPYRLLKQLGMGGMGAVYLALDTRLDRKLALKVMLPEFAADATAKGRFLREARAAAKITHDNVVTIYEADERDGVPYIAMQYLQGYPLDEYLKTKGSPALPHVLRIGRESAAGLAAAHALGLVHRDIKPANLWLEAPAGRVKVLDFGLVRPAGSDADLTRSGAVVGTPAYMSPEQARGLKVDHRTDLFSLGAVLYRLCAGQAPFAGPNVMAVLMALGTEEPTPVREMNPNIPEGLAALIHQLLAKNPDARPQAAAEVVKRLRAIFDELLPAQTPSFVPPVRGAYPAGADPSTSDAIILNPVPDRPPLVTPMQVTVQPESAFDNLLPADPTAVVPVRGGPKRTTPRGKGLGVRLAAGAAVLLAVVAGVLAFTQPGKKGEPVAEAPTPTFSPPLTDKGEKGKPAPVPNVVPAPVKEQPKADPPAARPKAWAPVPVGMSPFDKLDPKEIPAAERFDWQPKELVAVAGTHSPRTWTRAAGVMAVSPDGSLGATGGQHSPLRVWDVKTRTLKADLPGHTEGAVAFEPDGGALVSGNGGGQWLRWKLTTPSAPPGRWEGGRDEGDAAGLWFAPDASRVVVDNHTVLSVWDLTGKTAKALARFPKRHYDSVTVTPDGKRMAHYSDAEKRVLVHDLSAAGAKERWKLDAGGPLALSPDGSRLVGRRTSENSRRKVWDLTADPPTDTDFDDPEPPLSHWDGRDWPIAFSPDGKRLVTQTRDGPALRLWDMSGAPKEVWAKPFPVFGKGDTNLMTRVGFAGADGRTLIVFSGLGLVHFIDVSGAEPKWLNPIDPAEPAGSHLAFEGATGRVALRRAGDERLQWWDFGRAKPGPTDLTAPALFPTALPVITVAVTPDGGKAASWANDTLSLMVGGKSAGTLQGMSAAGVFAADGRTYYGFGSEGQVVRWDLSGGEPRASGEGRVGGGQDGGFQRLTLHRNETVLACRRADKLTFLDTTGPELRVLTVFPATGDRPGFVVFPDAERVLMFDGSLPQLWQQKAADWAKVWTGVDAAADHLNARVASAHPSGRYFALYAQGTITVRRVEDGAVVHQMPCKAPPHNMAFAPDGRHLFVANGFNTVYVLRLPDLTNK